MRPRRLLGFPISCRVSTAFVRRQSLRFRAFSASQVILLARPLRDAEKIAVGIRSLVLHGFEGIGLNAILHAARVPKGSFCYYFKSKEEFARAVLDAYDRAATERQNQIFKDPSRNPLQGCKITLMRSGVTISRKHHLEGVFQAFLARLPPHAAQNSRQGLHWCFPHGKQRSLNCWKRQKSLARSMRTSKRGRHQHSS